MSSLGNTSLAQAASSVTTAATAAVTPDVVIPSAPERYLWLFNTLVILYPPLAHNLMLMISSVAGQITC